MHVRLISEFPVLFILFLTSAYVSMAADRLTDGSFVTRSEVMAPRAMAATSHPLATQIALDVMRSGGNAIDAAIAANAALGLMEPTGSGIGGDLYAIVWDAGSEQLYGYNASGRSPRGLTYKKLLEELNKQGLERIPSKGVLPISVPGCVDGWFALHDRWGAMSMSQVLEPTIRYARDGFPLSEVIAYYWERAVAAFADQPGFLQVYANSSGDAPAKGEMFRNPALAETLEQIGIQGRSAFYEGEIAAEMVEFVQAQGGYLSQKDLSSHTGNWVEPLSTTYRGVELWELPPNGQGIAALQMLNILEGYDFSQISYGSPQHIHLFTEAKKLVFADRARFYSDPAFNDLPIATLISKEYAARRREAIDPDKAALAVDPGLPDHGDTIYLSTADADGNMVSLIQSNYRGHGSGVTPPKLGFCLQNRGELFNLDAAHYNVYAPGKRPFHTIIPAFITREGKPWVSFGVMGGATQPQAHVQIVMNLVDFGMHLQEAGDAPRFVHTGSSQPTGEKMRDGGELHIESGLPDATYQALRDKGHRLTANPGVFGGYQAIMRADNGVWIGASESRKDGHAAGF